jgi:tetratricopeptide (TPR) repeat protein
VFSLPIRSLAALCLGATGLAAGAAAAVHAPRQAPTAFYTVTAELALARLQPHLAAVQYAAAADADATILPRAVEVAEETLQPSIELRLAERWMRLDAKSTEARRAAGLAALALHRIDRAAAMFRDVIQLTPGGVEAGFGEVEKDLRNAANVFGARQVADRLAGFFPTSAAARRLQAFAALRGEDAAAAVASFELALKAAPPAGAPGAPADATGDPGGRREMLQALRRARIFSGAADAALAESRAAAERDPTVANQFDYAVLLVVAKRDDLARQVLKPLLTDPQAASDALRLAGLMEYQDGDLDTAAVRFTQLASTGHYAEDALYYLGLIAERHADFERALNCYARVQGGDNAVPALLRAATILQAHGEAQAAGDLLEQLLADEPSHGPDILAARAQMLEKAGDGKKALALLEAALTQYPDSEDLQFAHASTLEDLGRVDDTLKELAAVQNARPLDPAAWNALGFTLADHSRSLPKARSLIERALAAAPQSAAIQDSMGWVLYRQGHAAEAVNYLSSAFDSDPGADIGAHLGEVLWQLGRRAEAEKIWTQASAVDAESKLLKSTRRRLHTEE